MPSKVEDVAQYHDQSIAFKLRNMTELKWLTISWGPSTAHLGAIATEPRRGSTAELYSLGESIRRNLRGLILADVSMPEKWERVAKLSFSERLEGPPSFYMYVEIMNKHSNLIICNLEDRILFAANQIGSKKSSERQIQTKRRYEFPPKVSGLSPDKHQSFQDWKACLFSCASLHDRWDINYCISRSFRGVGPIQAQDIIDNSNIPEISMSAMSDEQWASLFSTWLAWLEAVEDDRPLYCLSTDDVTKHSVFRKDIDIFSDLSPLEFFGGYFYSSIEMNESTRVSSTAPNILMRKLFQHYSCFLQLLVSLIKNVSKEKDRKMKKLTSLQTQADASSNHHNIRMQGDLIMSNLHLLVPGTSFAMLDNWETGEKEYIKMDPDKSGIQNAEFYYRKAKKAKRGAAKIAPLIEECNSHLDFLEETEILLHKIEPENPEAIDLLHQIESDLTLVGCIKKKGIHKIKETSARKKKKRKGPTLRRLTSPNGIEVLVGRSCQENDTITMNIAKPGDIWMHARGYPGAHVLLRSSQSADAMSVDDMKFAADIAAFYSKGSALSKVDIIMADKKNISKPRGARPGQVTVHKEQVIVGEPDNAAIS